MYTLIDDLSSCDSHDTLLSRRAANANGCNGLELPLARPHTEISTWIAMLSEGRKKREKLVNSNGTSSLMRISTHFHFHSVPVSFDFVRLLFFFRKVLKTVVTWAWTKKIKTPVHSSIINLWCVWKVESWKMRKVIKCCLAHRPYASWGHSQYLWTLFDSPTTSSRWRWFLFSAIFLWKVILQLMGIIHLCMKTSFTRIEGHSQSVYLQLSNNNCKHFFSSFFFRWKEKFSWTE